MHRLYSPSLCAARRLERRLWHGGWEVAHSANPAREARYSTFWPISSWRTKTHHVTKACAKRLYQPPDSVTHKLNNVFRFFYLSGNKIFILRNLYRAQAHPSHLRVTARTGYTTDSLELGINLRSFPGTNLKETILISLPSNPATNYVKF